MEIMKLSWFSSEYLNRSKLSNSQNYHLPLCVNQSKNEEHVIVITFIFNLLVNFDTFGHFLRKEHVENKQASKIGIKHY